MKNITEKIDGYSKLWIWPKIIQKLATMKSISPERLLRFIHNYFAYGIYGDTVRLDAASVCQLKCPACPSGSRNSGSLSTSFGNGLLSFENFKTFCEKNPTIKRIELSNSGEILLNPDLGNMIAYAKMNRISLLATTGVNFNHASDQLLEQMVTDKFQYLVVSIDGASEETYRAYRIGGNLSTVINNIKKINKYKKKHSSPYPKLCWQFIIFGHNEHEISKARRMAEELDMEFKPMPHKTFPHSDFKSPYKDIKSIKKDAGFTDNRMALAVKNIKMREESPCYAMWTSPQINWDGKFLGCGCNKFSDYGNAFQTSLKDCLKSEKFLYARKMLLGKVPSRNDIPCTKCPHYSFRAHFQK